jgi:two-component system response regulator PilR (NtrC family)
MTSAARILVVDDERSMREMLSILLKRAGHDVTTATSGQKAKALLDAGERFDLVVTDLLMDRGGGLDVLAAVKAADPATEVIVITAFGTTESAVEAMKRGAWDYLAKPFGVDEFLIVVGQALERRALIRENNDLRARVRGEFTFADITGRSKAMRDVIGLCRKVTDSTASIIVSGESGTGKELIARAIHCGGPRAAGPFVAVNCGALPEPLMESELFGHVKGAFTGAAEDKPGLFRAADGGTLFLDEVGELPLPLQVKLLRVLQERTVRPVGGEDEHPIDVRLISASNRELADLVERGAFRTDLFYRLNVIQVRLPPLRERREDLPLLTDSLLARLAREAGTAAKTLSPAALRVLADHDWPGNVRELANVLERAATLADGERIEPGDLPGELSGSGRRTGRRTGIDLPEGGVDLEAALAAVERGLIEQALSRTNGNRTAAAELLGVSFRSLRYRLPKLGIDPGDGADEK